MSTQTGKKLWSMVLLLAVALVLSGCAGANTEPATSQSLNPTVVVVQYVTQVVATVTPAPPTSTPLPATALPIVNTGYDPYKAEIYYPLLGCQIASRLHVGDRAFVADTRNGTLGLHYSAGAADTPIFRKLDPGEVVDVIEGPYCRDLSMIWGIIGADGQKGYVAEGNGESYWLLPLGEKVAKELMPKEKETIYQFVKLGPINTCGR